MDKPIYVVGDENGHVYSPIPNMIYAREHFRTGDYGKTHSVEIPERYRGILFRYAERIFVVFEGDKAYFNGKDFRRHISESFGVGARGVTIIQRDEIETKGTRADELGTDLVEKWAKGE